MAMSDSLAWVSAFTLLGLFVSSEAPFRNDKLSELSFYGMPTRSIQASLRVDHRDLLGEEKIVAPFGCQNYSLREQPQITPCIDIAKIWLGDSPDERQAVNALKK
jgi:hypothetical protein